MRRLVRLLGQGLVVEGARRFRIEAQVELVFPAELEAGAAHGVVPHPRTRVALGEVGGVGGDLVGDDPVLDVLAIGQAQMFLRRDVAKHGRAVPADHRRTDRRGDVVVAGRHVGGQRPKRIEGRFAAGLQLLVHIGLDLVHRHVAGAFDHALDAAGASDPSQFAQRVEFGELRGVIGVGDRTRTQAVAQRERHVVGAHDVADLVEMRVEEVFLVMRQAPLGHDRAAARDDAGDALGRQVDIGQAHAGMDGEIVDALLSLFDQGVAIDFPGQVLGDTVDLFQGLVDRHGADRRRRIADDPLADIVDIAAGRQVHDIVGAPADRPHHFFDLFLHRRGDGRIADIGVDLDQEVAADDHRLDFGVVDIGRDDGAAAGDLVADEFRRDEVGDCGAEILAVADDLGVRGTALVLANGDEFHFRRDDAATGIFVLGD